MKTTSLISQTNIIIKFSNKIFICNFDFQLLNNLPRIIKNVLGYYFLYDKLTHIFEKGERKS